jgi:LmbE family N-acetylglucosaminyl deacetylase
MARLACVPSEQGSAAGFPKKTIIPQKHPPDEVRSFGGTLRTLSATLHAVTLLTASQCLPNWSIGTERMQLAVEAGRANGRAC